MGSWSIEMTPKEYSELDKYIESHPWLINIGFEAIAKMFLGHYRRRINLNKITKK